MLTRDQIEEAIALLQRVGVELSFNCPNPCGQVAMPVSGADAAAYAKGEINLPAKLTGLTPQEFAEWIESGGYMRCASNTRTGRRCKKLIRAHQVTDPQEWKRLMGERRYCAAHGG